MNSRILTIAALFIFLTAAASAYADSNVSIVKTADGEEQVIVVPAEKLGFFGRLWNGTKNVLLAPLDIPCTIVRHNSEGRNPIIATVSGSLEGVMNGAIRMTAGAAEVVTSPVPGERFPLYERDLGERSIRAEPAF